MELESEKTYCEWNLTLQSETLAVLQSNRNMKHCSETKTWERTNQHQTNVFISAMAPDGSLQVYLNWEVTKNRIDNKVVPHVQSHSPSHGLQLSRSLAWAVSQNRPLFRLSSAQLKTAWLLELSLQHHYWCMCQFTSNKFTWTCRTGRRMNSQGMPEHRMWAAN